MAELELADSDRAGSAESASAESPSAGSTGVSYGLASAADAAAPSCPEEVAPPMAASQAEQTTRLPSRRARPEARSDAGTDSLHRSQKTSSMLMGRPGLGAS